ncbi:MAG: SMC-Scp complex subunit ScpB [Anaerolineae bacterium]|nr:SMC-Scp complex subunit ScpB [Anaerolineae bacterium]
MSVPSSPLSVDALVEALVFAASQPLAVETLAETLSLSQEELEDVLIRLEARLISASGLRLQRHRGRVQLVTAPAAASYIEQMLRLEVNLRLSQAALETLSIVAYAQPITRPQIEAIRGVNSDSTLRTLLAAGLLAEVGRADSVGRPMLYGTTLEFLQQFGLQNKDELPALKSPEGHETQTLA